MKKTTQEPKSAKSNPQRPAAAEQGNGKARDGVGDSAIVQQIDGSTTLPTNNSAK